MCERCYEEVVDRAIKRGRITAAQRDSALRLFEADATTARAFIEELPTSPERAYVNAGIARFEGELAHRIGVKPEDLI